MPRSHLSPFDKELREIISQNLKYHTQNLTQFQLSIMTGIPASTLSGYFAKRSTPNAGNIQKIADALHLQKSDIDPRFSSHFLRTGKLPALSDASSPQPLHLSPQEQLVLEKYRNLSTERKKAMEIVLDALANVTDHK